MIRRPPRSTQSRSSAASDVYKRQPTVRMLLGHWENKRSLRERAELIRNRTEHDTTKIRIDFGLFRGAMTNPENALPAPNKNTLPLAGSIRNRTEYDKTKTRTHYI